MSIKSVTLVFNERIVRDATGITVYENYRVEFTSLSDDFATCLTAVDPVTGLAVPNASTVRSVTINDSPTNDPTAAVTGNIPIKSIEPTRDGKLVVNVLVTFLGVGSGNGLGGGAPTIHGSWNVSMSIKEVPVEILQSKDNGGSPITNSALEPISPGLPNTKYDREITISWNTRTPPIAAVKALVGKINSSNVTFSFNGQTIEVDAQHLKLVDGDFSGDRNATDPNVWKCVVKFYERRDTDGWLREYVDEGTYYLDTSSNRIPAPNGQSVYLDGAGHQLASGSAVVTQETELEDEANFTPVLTGI